MYSKYYKIIRGYSAEDYIEITPDELEKAFYCFLTKKDSVYSGGAVKGSEILAIQPDYHRTMGWTRGWKLTADDYTELRQRGIDKKMQLQIEKTKDKIQYLMQTKQENLIGKNVEIPELEKGRQLPEDIKKLSDGIADNFKIK
jgi:hypothetical protein